MKTPGWSDTNISDFIDALTWSMRKALMCQIDHYTHLVPLSGCVNDARSVNAILERHADGTVNFATPRLLTGTGPADVVEKVRSKTQ